MQDSNIKELTVAPTPEWVRELARKIAQSYSIPSCEWSYIGRLICESLREAKLI